MAVRLRVRQQDLREGEKVQKEVHGRPVTVLKCNGVVYCVDSMCYHQGGPLGQGDIEEICGIPTIRCPWHAHRINLQTGGLLETDLCGRVCEKHGKQRVHKVYIDMDGAISVILDETFPKWESDRYNCALDTSEDFMHTQTSRGYGLGTFGSLQPSEVTEDEDMADDAAISSQPEPLIPYGGLDKYYLPPSPLKTKPAPNSASKTEARPTMPQVFRGRKLGTASYRGAVARSAVLSKMKPPPMASTGERASRVQQRPLTDFFKPVTSPFLDMSHPEHIPESMDVN